MKKYLFFIAVLFSVILPTCKQKNVAPATPDWQWRGKNRDGIYHETGLLQKWPAEGPELLWYFEGLGDGYTSVAIANEKLYVTGRDDDNLVLFVFDLNGRLFAKKIIGKEWDTNFEGPRCSVVVDDGKLYIGNSLGQLFCLDESTLAEIWKKDGLSDFDGRNIMFGMTENPLIVGDKIFMTPGGEKNNMVALNKHTGELIWTSPGNGQLPAYCSPLYIGDQQIPLVVTWLASTQRAERGIPNNNEFAAFHAETGELVWAITLPSDNTINPNTPLYDNGLILASTGYGGGSWLLLLKDGGRAVEQVWHNRADNQHHGSVKVGDYLYTTGHANRGFYCIDWKTGETKYRKEEQSLSAMVFADGMLYCYDDRGGMSLIKPNPNEFESAGKFEITLGTNQHWAHPVVYQGVLYIRHGDALMAYKVK